MVRGLAFAVIGAPSADVEFAAEVGLSHLGARTSIQCIKDKSLLFVMEVLDGRVYFVVVYSFVHMSFLLCSSTVVAVIALFCTPLVGFFVRLWGVLLDNHGRHVDEGCGLGLVDEALKDSRRSGVQVGTEPSHIDLIHIGVFVIRFGAQVDEVFLQFVEIEIQAV